MAKQNTSNNNPHDKLFKAVFRRLQHAAALISALLPEEMLDLLDMNSIRAEPTSNVDDSLHEHVSDLVFSMAFHGHRSHFVAVLEHKSFARRLVTIDAGGYACDITRAHMESNSTPPPMVAVMIIYHGEMKWNAPHALSEAWDVPKRAVELMRDRVYDGACTVLDLAGASLDQLRRQEMNPMATLALWGLARARASEDIAAELKADLDLFRQASEEPDGLDDVVLLIRYILVVSDTTIEKLKLALLDPLGEQVTEACMTGAQRLRQEGLHRGRKQGRQRQLLILLETRFGALPAAVVEQVNAGSIEELDAWAVRVLTVGELDDVFA